MADRVHMSMLQQTGHSRLSEFAGIEKFVQVSHQRSNAPSLASRAGGRTPSLLSRRGTMSSAGPITDDNQPKRIKAAIVQSFGATSLRTLAKRQGSPPAPQTHTCQDRQEEVTSIYPIEKFSWKTFVRRTRLSRRPRAAALGSSCRYTRHAVTSTD